MKVLTYFLLLVLVMSMTFWSCTKFVQIAPPPNQLVTQTVFSNDNSAIAAMTGIYSFMMISPGSAIGEIPVYLGLSADELDNFSTDVNQVQFYENKLNPVNTGINSIWGGFYKYIFESNAVLEGLNNSNSINASTKQELTGEAKFTRAFSYFYLVNLFGDIPLTTGTNYVTNSSLARMPVSEVYQQIVSDLKDAENLLMVDYSSFNQERVRPTTWAAAALLSRTYLYMHEWDSAEAQATKVINNSTLFSLDSLSAVFLANSTETIWQLEPVSPGYNTWDGYNFVLTSRPTSISLTTTIINSFEIGDQRKLSWVDSLIDQGITFFYVFKYKIKTSPTVSEYYTVLRLAEQYLARAEARNEQNNISGALQDLNIIRSRAGLSNSTAIDQASVRNAIIHERQVELFCEWGNRWLDLKRTGTADSILNSEKPSWTPTAKLFPILQSEIQNDNNLTQNPGY